MRKNVKTLTVLSLFDGIAVGLEALKRAGLTEKNGWKIVYYASEIDPWAIKTANKNHIDIIHVGDVCSLKPQDYKHVDIIIGGSPCQGFSRSGKGKGITTTDGKIIHTLEEYMIYKSTPGCSINESALFWEFIRMYRGIKELNPNVKFFFENVLSKKWAAFINIAFGIKPKFINSSLITAQNRERNYWSDIPCSEIEDLHITLDQVIPGAVSGSGKRGRKLKNDSNYTRILTVRPDNKSNCLTCHPQKTTGMYKDSNGNHERDITPEQAEALQTLSKGYTEVDGASASRRFELIGNTWTVDVVVKFFENIESILKVNAKPSY